jgi:ribosome-associated protein
MTEQTLTPEFAETVPNMTMITKEELKTLILTLLDDKKAEKVITIDLAGKSSIADYLIIATATSGRQAGAIADSLSKELKRIGIRPRVEGVSQGDWVLVDAGDIIVHLFRPEVRTFYNLEKMWGMEIPLE